MIPFTLTATPRTVNDSRIARIIAYLDSGWHRYMLLRRLKATVFTLQGLDDRTLSDIGLNRGEIESAVLDRDQERKHPRIDLGGIIARG